MTAIKKTPGRKPIHLEMSGGKNHRQRIWEYIRKNREHVTLQEAAFQADVELETTQTYLQSLANAGHLVEVSVNRGGHDKKIWRLNNDSGMEAPRLTKDGKPVTQGMGTTNMWRVMRLAKGSFDFRELARDASTPLHDVKPETARHYIKSLHLAGYLEMVQVAVTKPGTHGGKFPARWMLRPFNKITNLKPGVRAPMIQRLRTVYDPNWQQVVFQEEASDD